MKNSSSRFYNILFYAILNLTLILPQIVNAEVTREDVLPEVTIKQDLPSEVVLLRDGETFTITAPEDSALNQNVQALDQEQRAKFQERRSLVLSKMLSLLHWKYLKNGKGVIVGNRIIQKQNDDFLTSTMNMPDTIRNELSAMHDEHNRQIIQTSGGEQILFKQMAHDLVINKLKAIDSVLHQFAGLLINPKEIGFSISAGFGLGVGNFNKIFGGAHLVGLNIGIDFESKSLVFEVSHISEKMIKAITPIVANFNIPFNIGAYIKNPKSGPNHSGVSTYAPGVPFGLSGYSNYMEIGFMYGYPPLIFDFFGYFSSSLRSSAIKIQISPLKKGFLKMNIGTEVKTTLISVLEMKKRWFPTIKAVRCANIFASIH